MRYIERNPLRIAEAKKAEDYPWSSARAHISRTDSDCLINMDLWKQLIDTEDWRRVLRTPEEEKEFDGLRRHTMTGRPYGTERFLRKLEQNLERRVRALPVGRPKVSNKK
jgi:putative transposase